MTCRQQSNTRNAELAKIHIGAKNLGWKDEFGDDEYRRQLWTECRVKSAADLDYAGRQKFLQHMKACGFKPTKPKAKKPALKNAGNASEAQVNLIKHIWSQLHLNGVVRTPGDKPLRQWLRTWTKRIHPQKAGYDAPELLTAAAAAMIIERLKKWADRTNVDW